MYERYDKVVLTHTCRFVEELAYRELIQEHLPQHEHLGELIREKLVYFPTVTREEFDNQGRITDLIANGELFERLGVEPFSLENDRIMLCGSGHAQGHPRDADRAALHGRQYERAGPFCA